MANTGSFIEKWNGFRESLKAAANTTGSVYTKIKNVIGVLADCGYTSPKDIIKKVIAVDLKLPADLAYPFVQLGARLFGGFNIDELAPIDAVRNTPVPILFIHGADDTFVPTQMSVLCHEANPTSTRLHIIPNAGHGLAYPVDQEGYIKAARDFFSTLE